MQESAGCLVYLSASLVTQGSAVIDVPLIDIDTYIEHTAVDRHFFIALCSLWQLYMYLPIPVGWLLPCSISSVCTDRNGMEISSAIMAAVVTAIMAAVVTAIMAAVVTAIMAAVVTAIMAAVVVLLY